VVTNGHLYARRRGSGAVAAPAPCRQAVVHPTPPVPALTATDPDVSPTAGSVHFWTARARRGQGPPESAVHCSTCFAGMARQVGRRPAPRPLELPAGRWVEPAGRVPPLLSSQPVTGRCLHVRGRRWGSGQPQGHEASQQADDHAMRFHPDTSSRYPGTRGRRVRAGHGRGAHARTGRRRRWPGCEGNAEDRTVTRQKSAISARLG
jgi:hypothetical protein